MRLKNKKTGQEGNFIINKDHFECTDLEYVPEYRSLTGLSDEWEDISEEPRGSALDLMILTLANFIENEPDEDRVDLEDCKQMLEKLKAWKRLKDKGFRFNGKGVLSEGLLEIDGILSALEGIDNAERLKIIDDLDLLFCMEDEE